MSDDAGDPAPEPDPADLPTDPEPQSDARPAFAPHLEPIGAVDPNDAGLAGLDRATRRQGRSRRWMALALVGLTVGCVVLIGLLEPVQFLRVFGLASRHTAIVEHVSLSSDQPSKKNVRRDGPRWDIQVRWEDHGSIRRGTGTTSAKNQPYQIGEGVGIFTAGSDVSLGSTGEVWALLLTVLGVTAFFLVVAGFLWNRSRAWRPLPALVTALAPKRVQVQGVPRLKVRRTTRFGLAERGFLVNYEAVDGNDDVGSFLLLPAEHGKVAGAQDVLDLWSVGIQGPPFAVRRPSDGLWWLGSDAY